MMDFTPRIISALKKDTRDRSLEDFNALFEYFVQIPQFAAWSNAGLRNTCQLARYIECAENTVLFKRYTPAKCWYLLMSGSVYCGNQMYYGGSVFGQSTPPFPCVRQDDCVALEYCQIVVVEYTPQEMAGTQHGSFRGSLRGYPGRFKDNASVESMSNHSGEMVLCERDSVDGKSASSIDSYPDLLGLTEGVVDSDEESDEISQFSWHVADPLRECLGKKPTDRTEEEVETIFGEVSHLPSLIKLPPAVRKELCRCMLYKVYHNSGLRVSSHGQELHAWHVLLNGVLEVREEGLPPELLHVGDSFGMPAATQVLKQQGDVFTRSEDCHVLFIPRSDFLRIINQGELNTKRVRDEEDMVVLITELRASVSGQPPGDVVTAATPMRLISHLRDNLNSIDPDYTQDFLLTYRTFLPDTALLTSALLTWFKDSSYRYKILSIVMSWVSSHFTDFDYNGQLWQFLEQFESELRVWNLKAELNQFRQLCASRTLHRNLVIIRDKADPIPLLVGGAQIGCPIFVTKTAEGSSFEKAGLRTFDELLQFNDTRLDQFTEDRVAKMLSQSTHFTMVVRSNKLDCKEAILRIESDITKNRSLDTVKSIPGTDNNSMGKNKSFSGLIDTFRPRKNNKKSRMDEATTVPTRYEIGFNNSHSYDEYKTISRQREAVKLYRDDQSFKYISIGPDTNALDLVYIAMEQFDISEDVSHFKLCEVIAVHAGAVRQKQLAPTTVNLANRLSLSSRYYLKDSRKAESLVSEDSAQEMLRDTVTNLLLLDAEEIARQLTINSFEIFREICSVEYVTDLFSVKSGYGTHKLEEFAETVNTEMYWVATEIVLEKNVLKRARLIKQFIKIAVYCQSCNNFNSMFCILSGLAHASVKRLDDTWCKLPGKWVRAFEDLHDLLDPSRNMYKYRTLVNSAPVKSPMIPFFPVLKKDLTFIHLGIESKTKTQTGNKLINFEKLRLVSREVQNIAQYSSVGYNPRTMFQLGGDTGSSARLRRKETNLASAASSSKKLYEQGLMQRKVALYLSKIINLDEATLRQQSHQCEAPSPDFQPIRRSSMPDLRDERTRVETDAPAQEPLPELKKSTSVESVSSKRYLSALDSDHRPRPEGAETLPPMVPPRLDLPSALQSSFRKKLEQSKNSANEGGTQPIKAFKSPSPDSSGSPTHTPTSLTPKSLSPASSNQSCNSTTPDIPPVPPRARSDTTV